MRRIMIRNATNSPIYVRPHLRKGWKAADSIVGFAEFALGVDDLKGALMVAGLSDLPEAISTFDDVHKVLGGLQQIDDGVIDLKVLRKVGKGIKLKEKLRHVVKLFKHTSFPITPGEAKDVFDRGLIDEITTPDGIASLLGAKTVAIAIITEDETQHVDFNSSETAQWVVTSAGLIDEKDRQRVYRWIRVPLMHRKQ